MRPLQFALIVISILAASPITLDSESVLHRFLGSPDGIGPRSGLVVDTTGDLYGATFNGGNGVSEGVVFRMHPPAVKGGQWTETILHAFPDINTGQYPWGGLVGDTAGNLYGTTWLGGSCGICGLVFELSPPRIEGLGWTYTIIHDFQNSIYDGANPETDLTLDENGNLFGTTSSGGTGGCQGGCGVVFELKRSGGTWTETVLYNFPSHRVGDAIVGGTAGNVIRDEAGNLYGTTFSDNGLGTVFELSPPARGGNWKYNVIYAFTSESDGFGPLAGLTFDTRGNLYGTTNQGGNQGCYGLGCGTVFRLTRINGVWKHRILYTFAGKGDGSLPESNLTFDSMGTLHGVTPLGGVGSGCPGSGCGVAFRLSPRMTGPWTETLLHTFLGGSDGFVPVGRLIFGRGGLLYGATNGGGEPSCGFRGFGCGTVFSVAP